MFMSRDVKRGMKEDSLIRRMFEGGSILKQRYGAENVFDLSLGNPVMEPPPEFGRELKKLLAKPIAGMHRYMPNAGYSKTRASVAEQLQKETGIGFCEDDKRFG